MTEKVRRDFTADLDKIIDDLIDDKPWAASIVADTLIKQLRDTDPELLAGWLDSHAHGLIARHITGRANLERRHARHAHRDAVNARVRGDFHSGDPERLTPYRSWHVVNDELTRKRASEMTGAEHHYVATQYRSSSRRTVMLARFHEAIAKKCGPGGITSDHYTEQQYVDMLQSLGVTA